MAGKYNWLFQRRAIGSKIAPNLLVLHPLERSDGTPEGKPRESAFNWYRQLAEGQWGVLFVECTTCSDDPDERGHSPNGLLMTERNLPEFKRLVREIKEVSPETILMIQLSTGSPGNDNRGNKNFMSLSSSVISRSLENMIKGGVLAAEAGFDGIDLKLCHGHLTFQLLRKGNKRQDEWGGETLRQRARFIIEAVQGIREGLILKKKEDFIIGARISETNLTNLRDIVEVLDRDLGLDFISVSNWTDVFDADAISALTEEVKKMRPKAAVIQAGFTSYLVNKGNAVEKMRQALKSKWGSNFVGFGRQAIADHLTPKKLKNDMFEEINWCKRCNSCFMLKQCKNYGNE
ncbi:MAG: oxidoreductase [Promethearchaeota archaeon]|jgi:2,4-dienoyl-CoA reductase-like NADH-dependent reductase (Old Yellow Enzyme family)